MIWTLTQNDKKMPLNAEPAPKPATYEDGTFKPDSLKGLFVLDKFDIVKQSERSRAAKPGDTGPFYTSHHATCPEVARFRKGKR